MQHRIKRVISYPYDSFLRSWRNNAAKLEAGSGVLARALQRHKWLGVSTFENRENRTEPDIVIAWRRTQRLLDPNPVG